MKSPRPTHPLLVVCAVLGALGCREAPQGPPAAPVDVTPEASAGAGANTPRGPHVIGAPNNPPGTAKPPMRASWQEAVALDDDAGPGGERACCAGKNECKGQSGCRVAKNGCAGKNDCKGQGTSCPSTPAIVIPQP